VCGVLTLELAVTTARGKESKALAGTGHYNRDSTDTSHTTAIHIRITRP